jgi:hypothetical protein
MTVSINALQDAKRERDAAAAVARQGLAQEAVVAREENAARINIIKAESAELLARLGIGKSK